MNKKPQFDRLLDLLEQKNSREALRKEFPQEEWSSFCNAFDFLEAQKEQQQVIPDPKGLQNVLLQLQSVPQKKQSFYSNALVRRLSYAMAFGLVLVGGAQLLSGPQETELFVQEEGLELASRNTFINSDTDFSAAISSSAVVEESTVEIDSFQAELDALYGELSELEDIQETQLFSYNPSFLDRVFPTAYATEEEVDKVTKKIQSLERFVGKVQTVFPHANDELKDAIITDLNAEIVWWDTERSTNDTDVFKDREKELKIMLGTHIEALKRSSLETLLAKQKIGNKIVTDS